ncbi:hypothetical protein [Chromobacterium phragmitis]|uniref:hypothetical protein n=1 Tax=Chromobacterium phragmitis TaxID=2202141 RepID=UPI0011AEA10C|nr:hypothetical protein [Chromobacterium phragmitis]
MRFFRFMLAPLTAPFRALATIKDAAKPKRAEGEVWARPGNHAEIRKTAARTSRILWYCSFVGPVLAGLAIVYDLPALMAYNLLMMSGTGVLLALRFALIARQMQTGSLERSRIADAYRDNWWFPG